MNKNDMSKNNRGEKISSLSNMVQLKLVESSHTTFQKFKKDDRNLKPLASIINTPSTIDDFKKFHSCDIQQNKYPSNQLLSHQVSTHRRSESATKILSVWQIKKEQLKYKQKQRPFDEKGTVKSPSRKIFISISKKSDRSESKKKQINPQMKEEDCRLVAVQPKRQKIKLNIYKNIALKNKHEK